MKRVIPVAILLLSVVAIAQDQQAAAPPAPEKKFITNITTREVAPSYSDLYCSGFVTNETVSHTNAIAGGSQSPDQTQFVRGNTIFIGGGGLQEGSQYSVIRELHDPNRYPPFVGQHEALAAMGQPYAELGRVRVVAIRGSVAVAQVEFSCQNMTMGDYVVPFREHIPVTFRKVSTFERFPPGPSHLTARIVMARDFDEEVGAGQMVYINAGTNKGVKIGDYFRAVRGYDPDKVNPIDALSMKAPVGEDTQKIPGDLPKAVASTLPERALGEMIVINVTQSAATAMITNSLEDIEVGDYVELEEEPQQ